MATPAAFARAPGRVAAADDGTAGVDGGVVATGIEASAGTPFEPVPQQ
ncbi:hypothetical protein [Haloarcula laminariae]|nr:hypothetical protein [Halomicroarcula sp. FL173]